MEKLLIDLGANSYEIYIGNGVLQNLEDHLQAGDQWVLITDDIVDELYATEVLRFLENKNVHKLVFPHGEENKNLKTVEKLLNYMLKLGLTRDSRVIALGGGVVGDMAGFCASIYMRGIPFIQVPTTLLAQVDSSVGGKTGVNLAQGKNSAGTFYQPEVVVIDLVTLKTLPRRELISGLAEVIKYGIISDYDFFSYLQNNFEAILALQEDVLQKVVKRCCEIKAHVVAQDEREAGLRRILNCGHTIGHALEIATGYGQYTHGEAVLIGMYYEAFLALKLGLIDEIYFSEIATLIGKTGFDPQIGEELLCALPPYMVGDKKNREGKISFILPCGPGQVQELLLTAKEVESALKSLKP